MPRNNTKLFLEGESMKRKRIVSLVAVILVITGMVWADPEPTTPPPGGSGSATPLSDFVKDNAFIGGSFDSFYAPQTSSTEARYSAGIFGSDVDDFIGVNSYDAEIGTFFFLGGYPAADTGVNDTDILTNNSPGKDYAISLGFGKTINSLYLGAYYGGSLVYAHGKDTSTEEDYTSNTVWRNRLALLLGTPGVGAFRFDMIMDTEKNKTTKEDNPNGPNAIERWNSPSFALTWGGLSLAGLDPYVTIGYRFPYKKIDGLVLPTGSTETTTTSGSKFGLQAGVSYGLSESSSVSGDILIGGTFGKKVSGDDVDLKNGGVFVAGLKGAYSNTLEFGKVSLGFKPSLTLGFKSDDSAHQTGTSGGADVDNEAKPIGYFEVITGVDLGVKFQATETIALYTGANLRFFDWVVKTEKAQNSEDKEVNQKEWGIDGIRWSSGNWTASNKLGLGMTITPSQGLVIGCGLNTLLDKFFVVDLETMQVRSGSFWNTGGGNPNNIGSYLGYALSGLVFDLTVSYKF
jgi:hypothetical protein